MKNSLKKLIIAAFCVALGIVLPFLTGQIQSIGYMLLPMHLPILLCGFLCGWEYGLLAGLMTPIIRSLLFTMPPMFPTAVSMALELAVYGLVTGLLYRKLKDRGPAGIYISLVAAMVCGRIVMGIANMILLGVNGSGYSMQMFLAGAFTTAVPGIILQLILIPILVTALRRAGALSYLEE